ncbi:MAG: calcium-translocating P-type ATPase, PMCA-type [Candidatus Saccharibacteria bacterium]|nr:calcium-translocating P-type ATPase, PMCA-type [Candidatus Saccharibacteria bacterium]
MSRWYELSPKAVLKKQDVSIDKGLSREEAAKRLKQYGRNELHGRKRINPLKLFISQFKDVLIIILIIAALVSFGVSFLEEGGSQKESLLILAIVLAIALVGFFNEFKAEKTVEALSKLVGFKARVRRQGEIAEIDATAVVPGDVVLLEAGQKIPADVRILEANELRANEASLTGESVPVAKNASVQKGNLPLGDQKSMLFAGTLLTSGSGVGVVVATAQNTEIGKIAQLVNDVEAEPTPMQEKLDRLGKKLGYVIAAICALVFFIIFFFVKEPDETFLHHTIFAFTAAVALAVAAIPEGLAFVVRISLALGARRMAGKKALVRKLSAVEALGSTDVICSDKTGTLTKGEMTVRKLWVNQTEVEVSGSGYETQGSFSKTPKSMERLLRIGVLCNNANLRKSRVIGDPTEGSLIVSAAKAKLEASELHKAMPRVKEIPFSSERKMMTTIHKSGKDYLVATKGAKEAVLAKCTHYLGKDGKSHKLTAKARKTITEQNAAYASEALRVLAFAYKETKTEPKGNTAEAGLTFIGLQAMMDPPRKEVIEVIHRVQAEAGMRVIMITGDYIETAKAIADEIGLKGQAISGPELDKLNQKDFEAQVEDISVYARVNPEHKIRIVKALKRHDHQVAMTGDGVNDAPAIKAADIGIAMGITGTDVSKEAADLILLDDQFLTIVNAIEEGRGIFDNVRKFVNFLISCNIAEVIAVVVGILIFNDLILTAAQLLFINIVTDGLPAVALGSDPSQRNILASKPKRFQEAILTKRVWAEIIIFGSLMSVLLIGQFWYNQSRESYFAAVSAAFATMVVYELVRLIDIRTDYKIKWLSNPWLTIALISSFALQIAVLYMPFLAHYFSVGPLEAHDWGIMAAGSIVLFISMKLLNPLLDKTIRPEHAHS